MMMTEPKGSIHFATNEWTDDDRSRVWVTPDDLDPGMNERTTDAERATTDTARTNERRNKNKEIILHHSPFVGTPVAERGTESRTDK